MEPRNKYLFNHTHSRENNLKAHQIYCMISNSTSKITKLVNHYKFITIYLNSNQTKNEESDILATHDYTFGNEIVRGKELEIGTDSILTQEDMIITKYKSSMYSLLI